MNVIIELLLDGILLKNNKNIFKISFKNSLEWYYQVLGISRWSNYDWPYTFTNTHLIILYALLISILSERTNKIVFDSIYFIIRFYFK